jgi:Protein of unknown function (DUF1559)/Domain of unknown function (DUF4190)
VFIPVDCECGQELETSDANAGRRARCPVCGRALIVPIRAPVPETFFISDAPELRIPSGEVTSGKAIASLGLGVLFFFACLSGIPAILLGRQALLDIDQSGGRLRGRRMASAGIVLGLLGCLFTIAILMVATGSSSEPARRTQCVNNLKQIGLGFHNYHQTYNCLPPAAITDKNGRPLLSWRVAILDFLESTPAGSKFHLDEPWDSPHNLSLLEPMPRIYACPSDSTQKSGMTGYQAVIGPRTAFTPDFKPVRIEDITDGTNTTLLVGESRRHVPWTKPDDLPIDTNLSLSDLGSHHGYHSSGFNALFANGSVWFLKSSITPSVLRAILSRDGGEVVSPDSFLR